MSTTNTAATSTASSHYNYRELQEQLRDMRNDGCEFIVNPALIERLATTKLNSKRAVLAQLFDDVIEHITATIQIRQAEDYLAADGGFDPDHDEALSDEMAIAEDIEEAPELPEHLQGDFDALMAEADEAIAELEVSTFDTLIAQAAELEAAAVAAAEAAKAAPAIPTEDNPLTAAERVIYTAIVWLGLFLDFCGATWDFLVGAYNFARTAISWARYGVDEYVAPALGAAVYAGVRLYIRRKNNVKLA